MKRMIWSLAAGVLAAVILAGSVRAEMEITSEDVGLRIQYANLRFNDRNWGWDPMYFGYYDLAMDPWVFSGMLGWGSGWDIHAARWDGQVSAGYRLGPLFLGGGYHLIHMKSDNYLDETWSYHGPELLAGGGYTFGDTDVSVYGSASLLPYVFTSYKNDAVSKETGNTWGYTLDGGVSYAFLEFWRVSAGYRYLQLQDTDLGDLRFYADRFHGPYIEGCFIW
jgi:hypothetical protein